MRHFGTDDVLQDWVDTETGDEFWVERRTGRVYYFTSPRNYAASSAQPATTATLRSNARTYAGKVYARRGLGHMREVETQLVGGEETENVFEYREYIDNMRTFNMVRVSLDEWGRVLDCTTIDEDVAVDLTPAVDSSEALATVVARSGFAKRSGEEIELSVVMLPNGEQHLVWDVVVRTGDTDFGAQYWAEVDAHTGELLRWASADR